MEGGRQRDWGSNHQLLWMDNILMQTRHGSRGCSSTRLMPFDLQCRCMGSEWNTDTHTGDFINLTSTFLYTTEDLANKPQLSALGFLNQTFRISDYSGMRNCSGLMWNGFYYWTAAQRSGLWTLLDHCKSWKHSSSQIVATKISSKKFTYPGMWNMCILTTFLQECPV